MGTDAAEDLEALARQVREHRVAAGLTIEEAAERGGMSHVTWAKVEKALLVRNLTYGGIERVLSWQPGSVARILSGGEPRSAIPRPASTDMIIQAVNEVLASRYSAETKIKMIEDIVVSTDYGPSESDCAADAQGEVANAVGSATTADGGINARRREARRNGRRGARQPVDK